MPERPDVFTDLRARVDKALVGFLDAAQPRLDAAAEELAPVGAAIRDLVGSGKRLRPAFCYWGWRGAGADDADGIVTAATSLELLHACAIVHDDVMDRADTRRGMPAVHRRFAELHSGAGWTGDSAAFGESAAILIGDLCLAWSDEMFSSCGLPAEAITAAREPYDAMRTEVMAGQYLDLLEQARADTSVDGAMRVVRYKSAKYTVERPLHIGARLAGCTSDLLTAYTAYGVPLGEAFQLRDDVLGVYGDPAVTGKPAGDDLREGKRTVLLAMTLERATPAQRDALERLVGDPGLDDAGLDTVRAIITDVGALDAVEDLITELLDAALAGLDTTPLPEEPRAALHALAEAATDRAE